MRRVVIKIVMFVFFLPILGSFNCLPSDYDSYEEYLSDWQYRTYFDGAIRPLHEKLSFIPEPWRSTIFFALYIAFCYNIILLLKKYGYWDTKSIEETTTRNMSCHPKVDKPNDRQNNK